MSLPRLLPAALLLALFASLFALQTAPPARAQAPAAAADEGKGKMMLTIFLKHDQSRTLDELQQQLQKTGFLKAFPPEGVEVVSWYVMMGIGQVVTLRFPAERLREVNRVVEQKAWGAYRTEFFPTYDFKAVAEAERRRSEQAK